MLKLMYITNRPDIAQIAETAGVDRIFVDLEYIGKADRQKGMNTVQSNHSIEDVEKVCKAITTAELLVRVNPLHKATKEYCSSKEEIDAVISNGADIIMLPYFKSVGEVQQFITYVNGRVKTMLLLETPEAVEVVDDILCLDGIDSIHIGLNDLSLGYGMKFMFQLLANGTVEHLCNKFRKAAIPSYGFGGIASLGKGIIPAEMIIKEHYRLGSTCAILSRSFCNVDRTNHLGKISATFFEGIREIRELEKECETYSNYFTMNNHDLKKKVKMTIS